MAKIPVSVLLSFLFVVVSAQNHRFNSFHTNDIILKYSHLSSQQLIDTAEYYYQKNCNDTALICCNMIINTPAKADDVKQHRLIAEALNRAGAVYLRMCDYRRACEMLIKALDLCEMYKYDCYKSKIYANTGNIYYRFNKFDIARQYYSKALNLCKDSVSIAVALNNLGAVELATGQLDSAFYFFSKAIEISHRHNNIYVESIRNNIGLFYQENRQYDSAFHYFRLSLGDVRKNGKAEFEAEVLSYLGKLFFEINNVDSALTHIHLSNRIAYVNSFFNLLPENYLTLSQIEESKGRHKEALEHLKTYAALKDSIFDVEKFGEISQLQRLYEVSKTNEQIELLSVERQITKRTIYYQKIIWYITLTVLLLVSMVLLYIFSQKKTLNKAYKVLFEKNMMIIDYQKSNPPEQPEKQKKNTIPDKTQNELLNKILAVMEDVSVICDSAFSINKLVVLVNSNYNYVSQAINIALNKNFRSLLNTYRIREAQRLFAEPDAEKYTIETIANQVGFKSRSAFREAFKEVTGVSPAFYLKEMQQRDE